MQAGLDVFSWLLLDTVPDLAKNSLWGKEEQKGRTVQRNDWGDIYLPQTSQDSTFFLVFVGPLVEGIGSRD